MARPIRLCLLLFAVAPGIAAVEYPERPIRFIVPQAPGSASDTVARIVTAELSPHMGQPVVVENHPGGALTIGLNLIAKSAPDGYTIGLGPVGGLAISPNMVSQLPYDIERDFQPVALVAYGHLMLAVSPSSPFKSVTELIAYAKANPGKLMNASSGNGTPGHVGAELFKFMTGTRIVHVPYKGGAQAINDLIAGHVDLIFESLNGISRFARSGKVRALAVSGPLRSSGFPELPTVGETAVPGYEVRSWSGVVAPARLPAAILARLNAGINQAVASPTLRQRFALIGDELAGGTPDDFANVIRNDRAKWAEVIRRSGAKID